MQLDRFPAGVGKRKGAPLPEAWPQQKSANNGKSSADLKVFEPGRGSLYFARAARSEMPLAISMNWLGIMTMVVVFCSAPTSVII